MEQKRVRISDIAQELGLSTATVSNVLHGKTKKVSDETVKRDRNYDFSIYGAEKLGRNTQKLLDESDDCSGCCRDIYDSMYDVSIPYVYFLLSLEECVRLGISMIVFKRRKWMQKLALVEPVLYDDNKESCD